MQLFNAKPEIIIQNAERKKLYRLETRAGGIIGETVEQQIKLWTNYKHWLEKFVFENGNKCTT